MSEKVKVASMVIQYADGDTKVLSVDDARELHAQLAQLFAKPESWTRCPITIERTAYPWWWGTTWLPPQGYNHCVDVTPKVFCSEDQPHTLMNTIGN